MPHYLLKRHVYLYSGTTSAILLDLRQDKYIGLNHAQAAALSKLVPGWPVAQVDSTSAIEASQADGIDFANELVKQGLLTQHEAEGKPGTPVALDSVRAPLIEKFSEERPRIGLSDIAKFTAAYAVVRGTLRFLRLEHTIKRLEQRKRRRAQNVDSRTSQIRDVTLKYHYLRRFFYTANQQCLLDSLVLAEFLASHDCFPCWVIGVQPWPFTAHAWMQQGSFVLNGEPEYVARFAPILVI